MSIFGVLGGLALIFLVLVDSFETTILPRRVTHRYRFARFFYYSTWTLWRALGMRMPAGKLREAFLSVYGPLSMLGLLAAWLLGLMVGFALLQWSLGATLHAPEKEQTLSTYLYWSGITIFTLGYGDVTPIGTLGRVVAVVEAGMGFGFLAVIIGYLPVFYQAFSRRELLISLLDARAGSPPSAGQLLFRAARSGNFAALDPFLAEWERWAAELLESSLSYPVLCLYRSQHDNQSWLAALNTVLDSCAFLIVAVRGNSAYQAQLTFAMARHAAVDLALVLKTPPVAPEPDRLPSSQLQELRKLLKEAGLELRDGPAVDAKLTELRGMYEPFVNALSRRLLFPLPAFVTVEPGADNWQRSAWMQRAPGLGSLPLTAVSDEHFD